jgi:hypothetical protein
MPPVERDAFFVHLALTMVGDFDVGDLKLGSGLSNVAWF